MNAKSYLEGRDMAATFKMLRANESIWSFVVNNYLLGKSPFPFDLLYWNADSTRMPAAMHSFYLRNMYQENLLIKPGGSASTACRSTYATSGRRPFYCRRARTTSLLGGRLTLRPSFTAGLSNSCCLPLVTLQASSIHRAANMAIGRTRRTRRPRRGGSPRRRPKPNSWWPTWESGISQCAGGDVPARYPGDGKLKPLEDAPGSYVKVRTAD
jgi:polyhydroxyalkanoate synthase subunit PhaC